VERGNVEEHIIIVLVLLIYDIISNAVSGRERKDWVENMLSMLDCRFL
jgi:hypothetical protein